MQIGEELEWVSEEGHEVKIETRCQWHQAENCSNGRQDYGTEAGHTSLYQRLIEIKAITRAQDIDIIDEHDRVVYNNSGQRYDADAGHDDTKRHLEYHQAIKHTTHRHDDRC